MHAGQGKLSGQVNFDKYPEPEESLQYCLFCHDQW